jgi:hypothetical protein
MSAGESAFPVGLWLVPLILVLTVAGLFWLARNFRRGTESELRQFRAAWRNFQSTQRRIEHTAQSYAAGGQEPFHSKAAALQEALADIQRHAEYFDAQHLTLHRRANDLGERNWQSLMGAPYLWFFLRKDVSRVRGELERAKTALEWASEAERELRRLGWSVALQARETQQLGQRVKGMLDTLQSHGLQGKTVEDTARQVQEAQAALKGIPAYFFRNEEAGVLAQADRNSIISTYETLEKTRPVLEDALVQEQEWERRCNEANDRVAVLQRVMDETGQTLDHLPPGLSVAAEKAQFDQFRIIAQNLQDTLSRLEVESMISVTSESLRLTQAAQEMNSQIKRARRELTVLQGLLQELPASFKDCSALMASLSAKSVCPVTWKGSLDTLADLNRRTNALGLSGGGRAPDQISKDLAAVTKINALYKELARHCQEVEGAQGELVSLVTGPSLGALAAWLKNARQLAGQVAGYAPENWSKADAVASLPDEIETLAQGAEMWLPSNPAADIEETEIIVRLGQVHQLLEMYQKIAPRVENVQARLNDLRTSEGAAREGLENTQTILGQITYIVRSNELLSEVAGQEAEGLAKETGDMLNQLAQPQRGSVEKKARQARDLTVKVERAAARWLSELGKDTQAMVNDLSAALDDLDQIAQLQDAPVEEARKLLSSGPAHGVGRYEGRLALPLGEMLPEFKRRSDYWQSCTAALRALIELEHPLTDTYEQASAYREQTKVALNESNAWLRQRRSWPPTSISLENEQSDFKTLEGEWHALQTSSARAIHLVARYGDLSRRYQALADRINVVADVVAREQGQIEEIEGEIEEMAQNWQGLLYNYPDNPTARQEIQELLDSISQELSQIKRKYAQGAMAYNQVLQSLRALHRKIRLYKVALDEDTSVDTQGNVTRRR